MKLLIKTFILSVIVIISFYTLAFADPRIDISYNEANILQEGTTEVKYSENLVVSMDLLDSAAKKAVFAKENAAAHDGIRKTNTAIRLNIKDAPQEFSFTLDKSLAGFESYIDKIVIDTGTVFLTLEPSKMSADFYKNGGVQVEIHDMNNIRFRESGDPNDGAAARIFLSALFVILGLIIAAMVVLTLVKLKLPTRHVIAISCGGSLLFVATIAISIYCISLDNSEFANPSSETGLTLDEGEVPRFNVSFTGGAAYDMLTENIRLGIPVYNRSLDTDHCGVFIAQENAGESALGGKYTAQWNVLEAFIKESGVYFIKENRKSFNDLNGKDTEMVHAVESLAAKGIINGKVDDMFAPDDNITRAEIVTLLCNALGKVDKSARTDFSDVTENDWYYAYAASAQKYSLLSGYDDNSFRPQNNINNAETDVILARILENEAGYAYPENIMMYTDQYTDAAEIPEWSAKYVALMNREDINIKKEAFLPMQAVTRGEVAVMVYRLYKLL